MINLVFLVIFIQAVLTLLAAAIILRSYIRSRLTPELYLGLLFLVLTAWGVVRVALLVSALEVGVASLFRILGVVLGPGSFVLTYLFITDLVERRHNLPVLAVLLTATGVLLASALIYESASGVWVRGIKTLISNRIIPTCILVMSVTSGFYLIYKIIQLYRELLRMVRWRTRVKQQILLTLLGCVVGNFGFLVAAFLQVALRLKPIVYTAMVHYLVAWGALIILIAYRLAPHAPYMLMARLTQLLVIHESGLPCFTYNFSEVPIDEMLLSGLLRAIFSVGDEFFGWHTGLRQFVWGEANVLVRPITSAMVVLVSQRHHPLLNSKIESFARLFNSRFERILPHWTGDTSVFSGAVELIEQVFPFVG